MKKILQKTLIASTFLFIGGCSTIDSVLQRGGEISEGVFDASVIGNCDTPRVATIIKKLDTKEKFDLWVAYCKEMSWKEGGFNL